jgi:hypothetical protein
MAFSFQGKVFWADLSQGLVCCDLQRTTSDCNSTVDLGFIRLPGGWVRARLGWEPGAEGRTAESDPDRGLQSGLHLVHLRRPLIR